MYSESLLFSKLLKVVVDFWIHECVALSQLLGAGHLWLLRWSGLVSLEFG